LLVGGGVALSSHSAKAATRLAANTSPEPFSNIGLSLMGDAATLGGTVLMVHYPVVVLALVAVAVVISILMIRWMYRAVRKLFRPA
jgi:uncharacterized membrane protein